MGGEAGAKVEQTWEGHFGTSERCVVWTGPTSFVGLFRGMSGAAALARAKQRREAAVAAQAEQVEAEQAAINLANERAKERGLVEKTAGESGAAGNLCNKWRKWLGSPHGAAMAARLAGGGAPTVEEAKLFSTWTYKTRQNHSAVGRKGGGDSYGLLQIPYMLAKFVFPMMKYEGFVGLTVAEATKKNQEYCHELKEHWKALKVQEPDRSTVCVSQSSNSRRFALSLL